MASSLGGPTDSRRPRRPGTATAAQPGQSTPARERVVRRPRGAGRAGRAPAGRSAAAPAAGGAVAAPPRPSRGAARGRATSSRSTSGRSGCDGIAPWRAGGRPVIELERHPPHGVEVLRRLRRCAPRLLGRHVAVGADRAGHRGEAAVGDRGGHPEVAEAQVRAARRPVASSRRLAGLTSRCTRPARVHGGQPQEQLLEQQRDRAGVERAVLAQQVGDRPAGHELHGEHDQVVLRGPAVRRDHVRVAHPDRLLAHEAGQQRRAVPAEHLDRDVTCRCARRAPARPSPCRRRRSGRAGGSGPPRRPRSGERCCWHGPMGGLAWTAARGGGPHASDARPARGSAGRSSTGGIFTRIPAAVQPLIISCGRPRGDRGARPTSYTRRERTVPPATESPWPL